MRAAGARDDRRSSWTTLPEVRAALAKDVLVAYECDPAASGVDEIVACYPGLFAIAIYRVAHLLLGLRRAGRAAHADRARALAHRHRHPPGRHHRRVVLHRPRHRHRGRRDQPDRRSRAHLPGGDPGRAVGQAIAARTRRRPASSGTRPSRTRSRSTRTPPSSGGARSSGAGRPSAATPGSPIRCRPGSASAWGPSDAFDARFRASSRRLGADPGGAAADPGVAPARPGARRSSGTSSPPAAASCRGPSTAISPEVAEAGARFRALKALCPGDGAIEIFLRDTCDAFATAARMLAAAGTREFYHHAVELYGRPASLTADRRTTNLGLAQHFRRVVDGVAGRAPIPSPQDELIYTRRGGGAAAGGALRGVLPRAGDRRRAGARGSRPRRWPASTACGSSAACGSRRAIWRSSSFTRGRSTWRRRSTGARSR